MVKAVVGGGEEAHSLGRKGEVGTARRVREGWHIVPAVMGVCHRSQDQICSRDQRTLGQAGRAAAARGPTGHRPAPEGGVRTAPELPLSGGAHQGRTFCPSPRRTFPGDARR